MNHLPNWIKHHPKLIPTYRLNVAAIITRKNNDILWCERSRKPYFWQFPQGGVDPNEDLELALFREIREELGLPAHTLKILKKRAQTIHYDFPNGIIAQYLKKGLPSYIGQKQHWFLLEFLGTDEDINLSYEGENCEFRNYKWGDTQYLSRVSSHKRSVYYTLLKEFDLIKK